MTSEQRGRDRAGSRVAGPICCLLLAASCAPGKLDPSEIYERSASSIPKIRVTCASGLGTGSGFVVARKDDVAFVATNAHVAFQCDGAADRSISVVFPGGQTYAGEVAGGDGAVDVAVLAVRGAPAKPLRFAGAPFAQQPREPSPSASAEAGVAPGRPVVAIGYPLLSDDPATLTTGVVSAASRNIGDLSALIQIDAIINHGSSGGPLFNERGEVIGMNSAGIENLNFAVSYPVVKAVVHDVLAYGSVNTAGWDYPGVSIMGDEQASAAAEGLDYRQGLMLGGHFGSAPMTRLTEDPRQPRACDLVTSIEVVEPPRMGERGCVNRIACKPGDGQMVEHLVRGRGDLALAALWIGGGARVKVWYRRFDPAACGSLLSPRSLARIAGGGDAADEAFYLSVLRAGYRGTPGDWETDTTSQAVGVDPAL